MKRKGGTKKEKEVKGQDRTRMKRKKEQDRIEWTVKSRKKGGA